MVTGSLWKPSLYKWKSAPHLAICQFSQLLAVAVLWVWPFASIWKGIKTYELHWLSLEASFSGHLLQEASSRHSSRKTLHSLQGYLLIEVILAGECPHVPKHFNDIHHDPLHEKATETLQCLVPASCIAGRYLKGSNYLCPGNMDMHTLICLLTMIHFLQGILSNLFYKMVYGKMKIL